MGKKSTTPTTPVAPAKAVTPVKPAAKPAVKKQPAKLKPAAAKATPKKPKTPAKPLAKVPQIKPDDIALRAYYIAEKRRQHGLPGDERGDWIEAERQLLAESKPSRKKSASK